jgi:tetratricopeptide (TPR) repeat protein
MVLEPVNSKTWYFIHNNLGYCLNHCGRHEEAVPYLERAIDLDPLRHNAYKNMGIACEGLGQLTDAALFYIKAVQTNASDPRSLMHLELLAQKHPDLTVAVPNFEAHLQACRMAVRHAQQMGMEVAQGILPEQDRSGAPKV